MLLTLADAAAQLAVSQSTLRREISDGRIPAITVRRSIRIDPADLAAYRLANKTTRTREGVKTWASTGSAKTGTGVSNPPVGATRALLARLVGAKTR